VQSGYTFYGWYEGSTRVSTQQSYSFTVTAARTLQARATVNPSNCDVPPLLNTHWNQCLPYNAKCPTVTGAGYGYAPYAPAGCVAITMAQIMKHYSHPTQRTQPIIPSPMSGLPPIYGTTTYQWSSMQNTYGVSYSGTTQEDAVATLIKEIGVAVNMNYTAGGSGAGSASSVSAFQTNFGYYTDAASRTDPIYRNDDNKWEQLIYSKLVDKHPVFYGATNTTTSGGGHAFVCDGYECSTKKFHINWGWGNSEYDGYFVLSALNLDWNHDKAINEYYVVDPQGNKIYDKKYNAGQVAIFATPNYDYNEFYASTSDGVNTFAITANTAGTGGYVIPQGTVNIYSGTNQAYAFEAQEGYEIDQVFIDGVPDAAVKANGYYIFSNITANHSIIVTFKASSTGNDVPMQETETINIFPNPVENELFIRSEQQIEKVVILDISGRVVVSTGLTTVGVTEHSLSINVSHLPKGLYFVKIFAGNQSITKKIIKK
jgi:uncharacterized repeat protein (TIGR02543 family)